MNSKVVYATLPFIGCKKKKIIYIYIYIYILMWLCVKRKREWGKKE